MNANPKDTALRLFIYCYLALGLALALAIPAILIYKFAHGASWLISLSLLIGYRGSFAGTMFLMIRFKRFDPLWGTLIGLCFFALLFLSLRL